MSFLYLCFPILLSLVVSFLPYSLVDFIFQMTHFLTSFVFLCLAVWNTMCLMCIMPCLHTSTGTTLLSRALPSNQTKNYVLPGLN